jgi:hypothetical protein
MRKSGTPFPKNVNITSVTCFLWQVLISPSAMFVILSWCLDLLLYLEPLTRESKKMHFCAGGFTPTFWGRWSRHRGHVDIFGKGVPDFLKAFHCIFSHIMHSFSTNLRDALQISDFSLALPIHPLNYENFGWPLVINFNFVKIDEGSFRLSP